MTLSQAADCWIARHLTDSSAAQGDQCGGYSKPSTGASSLNASMAAAYNHCFKIIFH
jgi:hypothetical protein